MERIVRCQFASTATPAVMVTETSQEEITNAVLAHHQDTRAEVKKEGCPEIQKGRCFTQGSCPQNLVLKSAVFDRIGHSADACWFRQGQHGAVMSSARPVPDNEVLSFANWCWRARTAAPTYLVVGLFAPRTLSCV